jgi:uncharacterized protein YfaT (DUF1175 family)
LHRLSQRRLFGCLTHLLALAVCATFSAVFAAHYGASRPVLATSERSSPVPRVRPAAALDETDSFSDGTPDFLRLADPGDHDAFRRWFTLLADYESLQPPARLPVEIDDCAALIRFAYRGALHAHGAAWLHDSGLQGLPGVPSVRKYEYPFTPLGASLFRVRDGSFAPSDLDDGAFAQFADVRNLLLHNTYFISHDLADARPGDLLFYRQLSQSEPYHSMIFIGRSQLLPEGAPLVIYHTGAMGKQKGEIRRLALSDLAVHPEPRWRPVSGNRNFLGVYRWNILRDAE